MRTFNLKSSARHITEANFRSGEKIVGANGEINAGSREELLSRVVELAEMIGAGEMFTDLSHANMPETASVNSREELAAAYHDPKLWAEMGASLAAELNERTMRDGFMRTVFTRGTVEQGQYPRVRVRTPNVKAVVSKGVGHVYPQWVRDRYINVDEATYSANVRVLELDMQQGSADTLEDKFYEAQEQILVQEDRTTIALFRAATGVYNPATYFSGAFTPTILAGMTQTVTDWNLPAATLLFSNDIMTDFRVGTAFAEYYDPISKYEIIQTGRIGSMYGLQLLTDGFREENLKVLNRGEVFLMTSPEMLGVYTDRGPLQSNPVDSYSDGVAGRGWFIYEHLSNTLANAKGIATASR